MFIQQTFEDPLCTNLELSGDDTKIMGNNSCPSRNTDSSEKDNEML